MLIPEEGRVVVDYEPVAYRELRDPREIKAFSDPLRLKILRTVLDRQATNQQIADELEQPPSKVFHHVRFLVDAGVIRLVETRVNGRNVEKYYRAVARTFILRPDAALLPETRVAALNAELEHLRHTVLEAAARGEDDAPRILRRIARLDPSRLAAFQAQLGNLIREYWSDTDDRASEAFRAVLTVVTYREPSGNSTDPEESSSN